MIYDDIEESGCPSSVYGTYTSLFRCPNRYTDAFGQDGEF